MINSNYGWPLDIGITQSYCFYTSVFTSEEIESIIKIAKAEDTINAGFVQNGNNKLNNNIRNTLISWIPSNNIKNAWIFQKLTEVIHLANKTYFNFDLDSIENLQFSIYKEGCFYNQHIDMLDTYPGLQVRKLSFSLQLSDEKDYEGGGLTLCTTFDKELPKTKGTIIFFPSYALHKVTPVLRGTRKALVGWVLGPKFK
jgi:PKHD-type hydroxylase